jgi:hypothetical protein
LLEGATPEGGADGTSAPVDDVDSSFSDFFFQKDTARYLSEKLKIV